ncbi:hypothetical protein PIB30_029874 [Stylosanthes scabra]|uniref:Uncharacterized protein n=1 Tax=Stylosanthes scabra TaxID=79078 RepID=A0ABU6ZBQ0_9FABA|nr:hypothetical protein [Stylosanthes scabra]
MEATQSQSAPQPQQSQVQDVRDNRRLARRMMVGTRTRIPAITGSDLLSPRSQALVPCCRGELRNVKELPLC